MMEKVRATAIHPSQDMGEGSFLENATYGFGSLHGQSRENALPQRRKSPQFRAGFFAKLLSFFLLVIGRGERIRTSDPLLPKQMRYRTALRPEPTIVGD